MQQIIYKHKSLAIFLLCALFLLIIRIPSFFGPEFSSDEGFYLSIGRSLNNGLLLYKDVWDNKPPLLYILYGINSRLFGDTIVILRIFNTILSGITIYLIYRIAVDIFRLTSNLKYSVLIGATLIHSFYFEMILINAENIFVPLILAGFLLFYKGLHTQSNTNKSSFILSQYSLLFTAGVCFGLASWTKLNTAPEILLLIATTLVIYYKKRNPEALFTPLHIQSTLQKLGSYSIHVLPMLITLTMPILILWLGSLLFFYISGSYNEFIQGVIGFSGSYLDYNQSVHLFGLPFKGISPLLINTPLVLILSSITSLYYLNTDAQNITDVDKQKDAGFYLLINWVGVAVFSIFLSSRGYPHYLQQALPVFIISFGVILSVLYNNTLNWKVRLSTCLAPLMILHFILNSFTGGSGIYNWFTFRTYYGGFLQTITNQSDTYSYTTWNRSFDESGWDKREVLVDFINSTKQSDRIYYIGSSPEIYAYTDTVPTYRYLVDYHIQSQDEVKNIVKHLAQQNTSDIYINTSSSFAPTFSSELIRNKYFITTTSTDPNQKNAYNTTNQEPQYLHFTQNPVF